MKSILFSIFFVFLGFSAFAQNYPVDSVYLTGQNDKRVVYVFLGDGYQESEIDKYADDVQNVIGDLFNKTPFKEYRDFFNIYRIDVPSHESGADHPGTASDVNEPAHEVKTVDTELDCTFDWGGIHRLIIARNSSRAFLILANNTADYDQAFVLSNTIFYGGSGGNLATSTTHQAASEISIHEIGHSFAGLWDEYWNGSGNEYPNMTRETDPTKVKWKHWLGFENVGIYPYGTQVPQSNWYRPHQNCEMRFLNREFCPVCKEQIIRSIYALAPPLESTSPESTIYTHVGGEQTFSAAIVYPIPNTLEVSWKLNGELIGTDVEEVTLNTEDLDQDLNNLILTVSDNTDMVRDPNTDLTYSKGWRIYKDLDGDGFNSLEDCDDLDENINPDAEEIVNNGIDEDCDGNDATTLTLDIDTYRIQVFPNPTTGKINLRSSGMMEANLSVINIDGKEVFNKDVNLQENELFSFDLSPILSNGIYQLKILDKNTNNFISELININKI